ncbi:MAG: aldehyde ferredoxin oxidoreductase family protein, partial [Planctomycetes bacterium]|nr:aldehyde ferredoxin oxidoreductase family protein [Planctomycetota bacterium]
MPYGYAGATLKVDLTNASWSVDEPPEAFYRSYLGGSGIGLHYLLREMRAGADPLGPDNVLTFAVGVVTGTPLSGQSRISANARSPLTGAIGDSQAGGYFPAELKAAGFDALVLKGRADRPMYLWIRNGAVELRDAGHLWGKSTRQTEDLLRLELDEPKLQATEVGPAGEQGVRLAAIMNMANRAHGRTGLGAVMGSKNLKAIAVRGTRRPKIADPMALQQLAQWGARNVRLNPTMDDLAINGTAGIVAYQHMSGGLPTRNWQSGVFQPFEQLTGDTMSATILKGRDTCYACAVRCKRVVAVTDGPYRVDSRYGGPEYETIACFGSYFGSYCGVGDLAAVAKANELCNAYGLDTIGTGATIAWAMECFEHGLLGPVDTGGLELRFGDADALLALVEQIAHRQGFGAVLAEGSVRAARWLGRGTEAFVNAVKGAELPAHMPEVKRSLALIYAVNPFGADHQSSEHDPSYTPDASPLELERLARLGLRAPLDARVLDEGKVRFVWETQRLYSLADTLSVCQFDWGPAWQLYGPEQFVPLVRAVTGWDVTLDELLRAAERRIVLMRAFNAREGFTRADDVLPAKLYRPKMGGASDGVALAPEELERAKDQYYRLAGWDMATGNPTPEKLEALGLG